MEGKAAVLEEFGRPLKVRTFPLVPLREGEVRVRIRDARAGGHGEQRGGQSRPPAVNERTGRGSTFTRLRRADKHGIECVCLLP